MEEPFISIGKKVPRFVCGISFIVFMVSFGVTEFLHDTLLTNLGKPFKKETTKAVDRHTDDQFAGFLYIISLDVPLLVIKFI